MSGTGLKDIHKKSWISTRRSQRFGAETRTTYHRAATTRECETSMSAACVTRSYILKDVAGWIQGRTYRYLFCPRISHDTPCLGTFPVPIRNAAQSACNGFFSFSGYFRETQAHTNTNTKMSIYSCDTPIVRASHAPRFVHTQP